MSLQFELLSNTLITVQMDTQNFKKDHMPPDPGIKYLPNSLKIVGN